MGRATVLVEGLGFSTVVVNQTVQYKQVDGIVALTKLTIRCCNNIVKITPKVYIRGSQTKFMTVLDAALNKFQMAVYAAKHTKRINQWLLTSLTTLGPTSKSKEIKPTLTIRLTLENDLRVAKSFKNIV